MDVAQRLGATVSTSIWSTYLQILIPNFLKDGFYIQRGLYDANV